MATTSMSMWTAYHHYRHQQQHRPRRGFAKLYKSAPVVVVVVVELVVGGWFSASDRPRADVWVFFNDVLSANPHTKLKPQVPRQQNNLIFKTEEWCDVRRPQLTKCHETVKI
eukprot:5301412-Amphidinium_carterae.1